MNTPRMPYILRYMRMEDISQVVEIDKQSFTLPWSARSYVFELSDNPSSHMVVVDFTDLQAPKNSGIWGTLRRVTGYRPPSKIVGYAGLWLIDGEAHISTIATHPVERGKGLGELLLAGMLVRSVYLKAEYAILEVRVSNTPAINLYKKYGFEVVGKRKAYYRDNNEDAYLMNLSPMNNDYKIRLNEMFKALQSRVAFTDLFTTQPEHSTGNK